jgi:hypothetical protein
VSVVPVPGMRTSIEERPEGLCFIVPARRQIFPLLFLPVWLAGWALGEGFAISGLRAGSGADAFLLIWLIGWTLGGCWTLFSWLWMLAGQERIVLGPAALTHRYELFGIGRTREYELGNVRRLRVSSNPIKTWASGSRSWYLGLSGGVIAFDYGAKTIRFGASLDEPEGQMIVSRLKERYGFNDAALPRDATLA